MTKTKKLAADEREARRIIEHVLPALSTRAPLVRGLAEKELGSVLGKSKSGASPRELESSSPTKKEKHRVKVAARFHAFANVHDSKLEDIDLALRDKGRDNRPSKAA